MASKLEEIKAAGVDLNKPATQQGTYGQADLDKIFDVLVSYQPLSDPKNALFKDWGPNVGNLAAAVLIAGLEGYADSPLLHPSSGIKVSAKTPQEDAGSIQAVVKTDMGLADAQLYISDDGDLYDWITKKIQESQKTHPQGELIDEAGPLTKFEKVSKDKKKSDTAAMWPWLLAIAVIVGIAYAQTKKGK